ncbi:hypothetical protein [Rufibacter psychrotolerans]|uniref:hypothetical protein n=1 Tax=Rufibacter psychrotolerans TaxID=2812556 RepID=UPI0019675AA6|nr:hypothetical protein [Rufibacter sp. SYSU D00308]
MPRKNDWVQVGQVHMGFGVLGSITGKQARNTRHTAEAVGIAAWRVCSRLFEPLLIGFDHLFMRHPSRWFGDFHLAIQHLFYLFLGKAAPDLPWLLLPAEKNHKDVLQKCFVFRSLN